MRVRGRHALLKGNSSFSFKKAWRPPPKSAREKGQKSQLHMSTVVSEVTLLLNIFKAMDIPCDVQFDPVQNIFLSRGHHTVSFGSLQKS